jgi:hypothetical protein
MKIKQIDLETLSVAKLPLGCVSKMIENDIDPDFRSICYTLMTMANSGRNDALTLLFGIAYRNRNNYARMNNFVEAVSAFRHPEIIEFIANEMMRVPSLPATRTYLRTLLKELLRINSDQSIHLLEELQNDKRLGVRFRTRIKQYFEEPTNDYWD